MNYNYKDSLQTVFKWIFCNGIEELSNENSIQIFCTHKYKHAGTVTITVTLIITEIDTTHTHIHTACDLNTVCDIILHQKENAFNIFICVYKTFNVCLHNCGNITKHRTCNHVRFYWKSSMFCLRISVCLCVCVSAFFAEATVEQKQQ